MTVTELHRRSTEAEERSQRWTPTRAGILNIWRYYDETFEYHRGRLLLRGPNGSGKSKALELLLPFLFDANLRPNRLSTFGTSERTMHWNLMGDGASGTTRVGYVWHEFGLGENNWFTCGARLQATSHTTTVHPDYFTTSLRIDRPDGLRLINEAGQPLTRSALEDRLQDQGVVHANASDYRGAIRSTLFPNLSEQQYEALITALLQLRTPKLSQRLDPALLSTLLSRALPPLGREEIADLAEGFERLDAQRERLKSLEEEAAATRTLAARQRTYAQRVLRSAAAAVVSATTDVDNVTRKARQSAELYDKVADEQTAAQERAEVLEQEADELDARKSGLMESEGYKHGQELDRLRQETAQLRARADRIRADATHKRAAADSDADLLNQALQTRDRQASSVRTQSSSAHQAAVRAGLVSVHAELADGLQARTDRLRQLLRAAVESRTDQLGRIGRAIEAHAHAVDRRQRAEEDLDLARTSFSEARQQLDVAAEQRESALANLGRNVLAWVSRCRELVFTDPELLLDHVESEPALLTQVDTAAATALQDITRRESQTDAALAEAAAERAALSAEQDRLEREHDIPPSAPPTRTADRSQLTGAPLWRLVDFKASVPDSAQAGIESAMEASGLLDAWVGSRGEIDGHDIFAEPGATPPAAGRSLADVLEAEPETAVAAEQVRQLLEAIAFDNQLPPDGPAAVAADGTWRMGALSGSWFKAQPAFIGSTARERARRQRLQELADQLAEADATVAKLDGTLAALQVRRQIVSTERAARPPHDELADADRQLNRGEAGLAASDIVVRQRISAVAACEQDVAGALQDLTRLAAETGLPTTRQAVDSLAAAVRTFRDQAEIWLDEHHRLIEAEHGVSGSTTQAERSASTAAEREQEAAEAERQRNQLTAKLEAVDRSIGADYREVLAEIAGLRRRIEELLAERRSTSRLVTQLAQRLGALETQRVTDAAERDGTIERRDAAAQRFRHLSTTTLPADSGLEQLARFDSVLAASDGVRATLEAARVVAAAWPLLPHAPKNLIDALQRLSESVHASRTALSARADLDLETDDDIQLFTAVVDGIHVGATELLRILRDDAERSRQEITDRERELFDQTLTGDTRRHLAARIRQANELVDSMNTRLDRVRTASNVAVRLVWQVAPDLPTGTKAARDLLLKDPVRLDDADRDSLHRFFRDRIEHARAEDTATSWEQQLAEVFDYTTWHRFVVKVDRANGDGWQLLTRKLHGALSGGEKAIVLHLPLFAAVAAHYQADPSGPRVILLDEVFVGVDTTNRGQVFGLLSALDLDLMLTSDHEWCTYAELDGIGIHQLITGGDGDDAVTTARFTWDGSDLIPAEND
jgi:uncharacterized protein (TIGR02680 family)